MKRVLFASLAFAIMCTPLAKAKTYTDKTYLAIRAQGVNIAMEYAIFHRLTNEIDYDRFGGNFQAVPFYQDSTNKGKLGQYFGIYNYDAQVMQDFISVARSISKGATNPLYGLHPLDIIHYSAYAEAGSPTDPDQDASSLLSLHDKLQFNPSQETYGARLDYHQKLDNIANGLFLKASVPIVCVKNKLGITSIDPDAAKQPIPASGIYPNILFNGKEVSLLDYLNGKVENNQANNMQTKLTHAKWKNINDTTGFADIDMVLGYNLLYKPTRHANINFAMTIPTGTKPNGEYLWQAVVGNGGHWAFGAGIDSAFQLAKRENASFELILAFNFRYLFEAIEKRTPGFKRANSEIKSRWGQYELSATDNRKSALFPAANIITQDIYVTPKSQIDLLAAFAINAGNWTIDLGYNLFAKSRENVSIKQWTDRKYATVTWEYNTDEIFDIDNADHAYNIFNKEDFLTNTISTPEILTHKLFGGIGYIYNELKIPIMLGLGGSKEIVPSDNDAINPWAIWGKIGFAF